MKKYLSVTIIIFLCLTLFSCTVSPRTDLFSSSFRCELEWSFNSDTFRADILSIDGSSLSILLTYPPELSGISIERRSDLTLLYLDGTSTKSVPHFYSHLCDLILTSAPFKFISTTSAGGYEALCYSRGAANWYFLASDGGPIGFDDGITFFKINRIEGA